MYTLRHGLQWMAAVHITLRPWQNGRHFADDLFKCIFLNENVWNLIKISLKFVPKGPNNIIPALVQIMASRHQGDKPLSEPMLVRLPTLCASRYLNEVYRIIIECIRLITHRYSTYMPSSVREWHIPNKTFPATGDHQLYWIRHIACGYCMHYIMIRIYPV